MNRTPLCSLVGVVLAIGMLSGCARLHLEEGQAAYQELRYQDAIHHFGKAVQRLPYPEAYRMLAGSHALINEHKEAAMAYSVLVALPEATDQDRLDYAAVLLKQGEYEQAERILNVVSQRDPGNEIAAALRQSAVIARATGGCGALRRCRVDPSPRRATGEIRHWQGMFDTLAGLSRHQVLEPVS